MSEIEITTEGKGKPGDELIESVIEKIREAQAAIVITFHEDKQGVYMRFGRLDVLADMSDQIAVDVKALAFGVRSKAQRDGMI